MEQRLQNEMRRKIQKKFPTQRLALDQPPAKSYNKTLYGKLFLTFSSWSQTLFHSNFVRRLPTTLAW